MSQAEQDAAALFKQAQKAHRKKHWQEATGLYEAVIAAAADPTLTARAQSRLDLVIKERRPNGTAGFWALAWHLLLPVGAFLMPSSLPEVIVWLPLLIAIVALVFAAALGIRALFEPGVLNKLAGLLAVLVLTFYLITPLTGQPNLVRAQVIEGISIASAAKTAVSVYYMEQESFPASNGEVGIGEPSEFSSNYVRSMVVTTGGVITINFRGNKLEGHTIIMVPTGNEEGVFRNCAGGSVPGKHRPSSCRK